ncbi:late competence development ComFB family protein [Oscillospiraceae bacterium MB08-C2-2]|nr:late competence development ComFB family protein [Oscillospiraceae bacterium MB08-C2-2]
MSAKRIKKDFDKEQMYLKIMPTFAQAAPKGESAGAASSAPEGPVAEAEGKLILHNFMEDMLLRKLDRVMEMLRCCRCERCKKNVMAAALNALPCAYYVAEPGEEGLIIERLSKEKEIQITAALIKAAQKIKAEACH